ncbi:hypothetical protein UB45_10980 [Terrabacter sp. 28]|nr:hypothetical protein UB45_10980 [Terrabacter sp. 28]
MSSDRIAIFEERELSNYDDGELHDGDLGQALQQIGGPARTLTAEAIAAIATRKCRFCRGDLDQLEHWYDGTLLLCQECGYWAGRGTRVGGPADNRVVRGVVDFIDPDEATLDQLVRSMSSLPERLRGLNPFRAEKLMMDLLGETFDCEVRPVGGRHDGGVDGYVLASDGTRTIVQVKWRETGNRGESVSVVRELAGTMIARGEPSALLVTTRNWMSKPAQAEMSVVGQREVLGLGKLQIDALVYQDIIDMLQLAWTRRGGDFESVTPWLRLGSDDEDAPRANRDWVFDVGPH